jgi:hypothetical protein
MKTNQTYSILFLINRQRMIKGEVSIYVRITINGQRAAISLKRYIDPKM